MNLQGYYFSGTGNSLFAARTLTQLLKAPAPIGIAAADLQRIADRIAGGEPQRDPQSSWFQRALWPGAMYALGYRMIRRMVDGFRVEDTCSSCGICAQVCPVENIELKAGRPVWGSACEQCLACLNLCPESAIQHGKTSADQARYRNPKVALREIIAQKRS